MRTKTHASHLHVFRGYLPPLLVVISGQRYHRFPVGVVADVDDALNLKGPNACYTKETPSLLDHILPRMVPYGFDFVTDSQNRTQDGWVGSANATSMHCPLKSSVPLKQECQIHSNAQKRKSIR